jgi:glutaredoxin-related protein
MRPFFLGFVALIGLLGMGELAEVKYKSRDVLADQELREGIKSFRYHKT